jgi:hypothetical protein
MPMKASYNGEEYKIESKAMPFLYNGTVYLQEGSVAKIVGLNIKIDYDKKEISIKSAKLSDGAPVSLAVAKQINWDTTEKQVVRLMGKPFRRERYDGSMTYLVYNLEDGRELAVAFNSIDDKVDRVEIRDSSTHLIEEYLFYGKH